MQDAKFVILPMNPRIHLHDDPIDMVDSNAYWSLMMVLRYLKDYSLRKGNLML